MFRAIISPILRSNTLCYSLWYKAPKMLPVGEQQAATLVHYTASWKHSLVFLRMGEIIARNTLSWLPLLIKLLLLYLVGCLYYWTNEARLHKHQTWVVITNAHAWYCLFYVHLSSKTKAKYQTSISLFSPCNPIIYLYTYIPTKLDFILLY